jgi:hypothetical protein
MARLGRLGLGRTAFKATLAFCTIMALVWFNPLQFIPSRTYFVGTKIYALPFWMEALETEVSSTRTRRPIGSPDG